MSWFKVYFCLWLIIVGLRLVLIPWSLLRAYHQCPKPREYKIAALLSLSIPVTAWFTPINAPIALHLLGASLYCGGEMLTIWARRINPFFLPIARKPVFIVSVGPYKWLKHPGFVGFAASGLGVALIMGSAWALIPVAAYWWLLGWRAKIEDRLLHAPLQGNSNQSP